MNIERWRAYAYKTVSVAGLIALVYIGVKFLLPLALPFLLAWGVAFAMRPVAMWAHRKLHLPVKLCRVATALLLLIALLGVLGCLLTLLGAQLWRFVSGLSEGDALASIAEFLLDPLGGVLSRVEGLEALSARLAEAAANILHECIAAVASLIPAVVGAVPQIFLFCVVTVIATVYISFDLDCVNQAVLSLLPQAVRARVVRFKTRFFSGVWPYVRSYLVLMLLTFAIMTIGLVILGSEYALLLAVIIALLDPLPVIGVGTILIPWSLFQLFFGDTAFGIGLLVLYIVHEIFRQIAEPRILGRSMGLHPLLTLVLLYVGYSLLGVLGLLLLPVLTVSLHVVLSGKQTREKTVAHEEQQPPTP